MQVTLEEVLHVPGMDSNLLSGNVFVGKGLEINPIKGTNILLVHIVIAKTVPRGKLLRLKTVSDQHALKTVGCKPADQSHLRTAFGTVVSPIWEPGNLQQVGELVGGMAIDPETFPREGDDKRPASRDPKLAKQRCANKMTTRTRRPHPQRHLRVDRPSRVCESRYFLTFIDNSTRMTYLFVLKTKMAKEVRECFLRFWNNFEQDVRCIKSIRTDGAANTRRSCGAKRESTTMTPYTPKQNGVAERANRTICERIHAILADKGLPKELWAELARAFVHLKNRSPTSALRGMTPEVHYRERRNVSTLLKSARKPLYTLRTRKRESWIPQFRRNYGRIWRIPPISNSGTDKIRVS